MRATIGNHHTSELPPSRYLNPSPDRRAATDRPPPATATTDAPRDRSLLIAIRPGPPALLPLRASPRPPASTGSTRPSAPAVHSLSIFCGPGAAVRRRSGRHAGHPPPQLVARSCTRVSFVPNGRVRRRHCSPNGQRPGGQPARPVTPKATKGSTPSPGRAASNPQIPRPLAGWRELPRHRLGGAHAGPGPVRLPLGREL